MFLEHPIVDADSHKCENPTLLFDYIPAPHRDRLRFVRDRFGENRFQIRDRSPDGTPVDRVFLQPEGYSTGAFRPYHSFAQGDG